MDNTAPYYRLEGHDVVPEHDLIAYIKWKNKGEHVIARAELHGFRVSTVFVGTGRLWFETMVFRTGQWNDLWSGHAWTWEEALAKHQEAIEYVESELV
jgi:hypothetical protein